MAVLVLLTTAIFETTPLKQGGFSQEHGPNAQLVFRSANRRIHSG
jgi:hypothetical protein